MEKANKPDAFKGERGNVYKFNLREHPNLVKVVDGFNVRQDFGDLDWLKESIIRDGLKVPAQGYYREGVWHLTDGERRFRASMLAVADGHDVIFKIEAEPKGYTDADRLVDMLTRNSGEPLKMLEEAELYRRLSKLNFSEHQIAAKTGKSVQHVRNIWKLLEAEPEVLEMVEKGNVAASTVVEMQKEMKPAEVKEAIETALKETGKKKVTAKDIPSAKQFGEKKKKKNKVDEVVKDQWQSPTPPAVVEIDKPSDLPMSETIAGANGKFTVKSPETVEYIENIIGRLELDVAQLHGKFYKYNDVPPIEILHKIVRFAKGELFWGEIQELFIG